MRSIRIGVALTVPAILAGAPSAIQTEDAPGEGRLLRFLDIRRDIEVLLLQLEREPGGRPQAPEPPDMDR